MPEDKPPDDEKEYREVEAGEVSDLSPVRERLLSQDTGEVLDLSRMGEREVQIHRETMRGHLARWLLAILAGTILLEFLAIFSSAWLSFDSDLLDKVLTAVFGPLIAIVGTVIGFYFGGRGEGS